ncbi:MAG: CRISPR-associated endonuclease Cas1 [Desulfurococcaceae archaeon]
MKTVLISGYGVRLRYREGLLIAESKNGGVQEMPLLDVDQLVVATGGVWLSSKLVRKLVEHGVDLIFLDSRGNPVGRVYPPFINRTVETRRAQYMAYGTYRGAHVMKELAYAKLMNQAGLLRRYYYYTHIEDLKTCVNRIVDLSLKARSLDCPFDEARERLRVIEAEAARYYWPCYATLLPRDLGFEGRDHDSGDPVNVSLNYAYGVLYGECWKALVLGGLDPYAGFLHVDRSGKPVLVFDFVEMFRFSADAALLGLFRRGWKPLISGGLLSYESRERIVECLFKYMDETRCRYIDEAPVSLRQAVKKAALALASYLRGEGVFEGYVHGW